MKRLLLVWTIFMLSGCSSFGRGIAEAILDKDKAQDNRKCEIRGDKFKGIDYYFSKGNVVKVMMIHGVGTHLPGYSTRIRENLASNLNLTIFSQRPKDILLINPENSKQEIGNLRVIKMQNEEGTKTMLFYELTWSDITNPYKKILDYDTSGEFSHKRAAFNNSFKKFLNDTGPDPMIYMMDKDNLILNSTKQATCWMLSRDWNQLKDGEKNVCIISSYNQIKNLGNENIVFITHSLGSRILMDSIVDIVDNISKADISSHKDAQMIVNELQNKELDVFMLANQLPMLQIGRKAPSVTKQIPQYCKKKGDLYNKRVFKKVNIVAFSDPNDLLSYDVPQRFVDEYMDSRMCPFVSNVTINVAEEISAFGVGFVNPLPAHTEYDNDQRIIEMISKGMTNYKDDKTLSEKCQFYHLKD